MGARQMLDVVEKIAPIGVLRVARRAALRGQHFEEKIELAQGAGRGGHVAPIC